jgi:hypothetical protein
VSGFNVYFVALEAALLANVHGQSGSGLHVYSERQNARPMRSVMTITAEA